MAQSPKVSKSKETTPIVEEPKNFLSAVQKVAKIQALLKVPKSEYNDFGRYNYRTTEAILTAVKPLCAKYGLYLALSDEVIALEGRFYVRATAVAFNIDNLEDKIAVSAYAREEETKKGMDGAQITGASSSYARKYALNGLFGIDDTKDPDAMDNRTSTPKASSKPSTAPTTGVSTKAELLTSLFAEMKTKGYTRDEALKELDGLSSLHYSVQRVADLSREQVVALLGKVKAMPKKDESK